VTLNDNALYEYLLQEDIFVGVAGIMECKSRCDRAGTCITDILTERYATDDPEYPRYKASYRDFLTETDRFKMVVPISDPAILAKIHQTYRLHYLKDVILARVLDDPTFNILNSLLFFNQIDIIAHIGNNDTFLRQVFDGFRELKLERNIPPGMPLREMKPRPPSAREHDIVAFLHQLMLMGKQVQAQHRLALYKILLERGLLYVCELALQRPETTVMNQGAEMISLILDHDLNGFRSCCLREHEAKRRTIVDDICALLIESKDLGLKSQMSDAIRALVDVGLDPTDVSSSIEVARTGQDAHHLLFVSRSRRPCAPKKAESWPILLPRTFTIPLPLHYTVLSWPCPK
jgi:protein phosphatase-4 regulatory subunit 3